MQANQAQQAKAEGEFLTASLSLPSLDGYQKALDAYRQVQRSADLVKRQQTHLEDLKAQNQQAPARPLVRKHGKEALHVRRTPPKQYARRLTVKTPKRAMQLLLIWVI